MPISLWQSAMTWLLNFDLVRLKQQTSMDSTYCIQYRLIILRKFFCLTFCQKNLKDFSTQYRNKGPLEKDCFQSGISLKETYRSGILLNVIATRSGHGTGWDPHGHGEMASRIRGWTGMFRQLRHVLIVFEVR